MIKKLLLSLAIVVAVGGSAIVATKALLSDQVTLTASSFSTGTANLQITVGADQLGDTHVGFTETVFPGQSKAKFFKLRNNNSGFPFEISAQSGSIIGLPGDKVHVSFTPWSSDGGVSGTTGHAETGAVKTTHTLTEWLTPGGLGLPNIPNNSTQDYKMEVEVDSSISTPGTSTFDFTFTGTQVNPTPSPTVTPSVSPVPTG
jgi:hypothetical protein